MSKHEPSPDTLTRTNAGWVTHWRLIIGIMALLSMALPVYAQQSTSLREVLSGAVHPLSMKLNDLDATWRRITVHAVGTVSGNVAVNVTGTSRSTDASPISQNNIVGAVGSSRTYVTQGQTTSTGGRIYLVAYRLPGGLELGSLLEAVALKSPPTGAVLTPDSELALSLLDLQSIGSLEDIRPFDMNAEISESEAAASKLANLLKAQGGSTPGNTSSPPKETKPKEPTAQQP